MARTRNIKNYDNAKSRLLAIGVELIRSDSFSAIGINDVLKKSEIPRGSFYHYFENKQAFGLEVAQFYHAQQMSDAQNILRNESITPLQRLKKFFRQARKAFSKRSFADGCLMCNLSTELADTNATFQTVLKTQWNELAAEIALCVAQMDKADIGMAHLTDKEVADWLLNAWGGALARMKAEGNDTPLQLFEKSIFKKRINTEEA